MSLAAQYTTASSSTPWSPLGQLAAARPASPATSFVAPVNFVVAFVQYVFMLSVTRGSSSCIERLPSFW